VSLDYGLEVLILASPKRRVLIWFGLEIIVRVRLKMMLQIVLDHLFCHLPCRGTKVPSRPKVSTPISLLEVLKFLEQPTRRVAFASPHDLTGRHRRWRAYQYVHMIFAYHPFNYPDLERRADLPHQLPNE